MTRRRVPLLALAVAMIAAAACGSRADPTSAPVAARFETGGVPSTVAPAADGQVPAAATAATAAAGGVRRPSRAPAGSDTPVAPAATGAPLRVGVIAIKPQNVTFLGLALAIPDMKQVLAALVEELNATGGIGGRPVELVVHEVDTATDPGEAQRIHEEACVRLTEDEKVFIVLSLDGNGVAAAGCYAQHRTPYIDFTVADEVLLREHQPWILPSPMPNVDTIATMLVRALDDAAFFDDARVAVWIYDVPEFRRTAESVLLPAIERAGGTVVTTFTGLNGDGASAVLRFRAADADRVVIWDTGITWIELATAASSQRYEPRWAVHSALSPDLSLEAVPAEQRDGTVGAGWVPSVDVPDAALPLTARERWCFDIVERRAGISIRERSSTSNEGGVRAVMTLMSCELLEIVRAALEQVPGADAAPGDVWALVASLGEEPEVITPPQTSFAPDRFDGGRRYALLAYDDACGCFAYRSGWRDARTE